MGLIIRVADVTDQMEGTVTAREAAGLAPVSRKYEEICR